MTSKVSGFVDDLAHKLRLKEPIGDDVSQQGSTNTSAGVLTPVNTITNTAGKVVRVTGMNYIDRAHISVVELTIDRGGDTERTITFVKPPHPAAEFGRVKTFDPPLEALTKVELNVTDDGTQIVAFESIINAFETDN